MGKSGSFASTAKSIRATQIVGAAALFGSFVTTNAFAQVNTEAILSDGRSDPWSAFSDMSFALRRGNVTTSRATLGGGGRILTLHNDRRLPKGGEPWFHHRFMFSGSWSLENSAGKRSDHVAFAHTRYTQMVVPKHGYEVFSQANFDQFQRLNLRLLLGGGYRAVVANDNRIQFWYGSGFFVEQEDYNLTGLENEDEYPNARLNVRWSTYGTLKVNAADNRVALVNTLYIQPTVDNFRDVRVYYEGRFTTRLYKMLAVSLSTTVTHDTTPVPGIRKTDVRFNGALQFRLYGTREVIDVRQMSPSPDELYALGVANARPIAVRRVELSLQEANNAVRDEIAARAQRRALAIATARDSLASARTQAEKIANHTPAGVRDLEAWRDPAAHAAMNAAMVGASVAVQATRINPLPLPTPETQTTPSSPSPDVNEAPDGLFFDPVIQ